MIRYLLLAAVGVVLVVASTIAIAWAGHRTDQRAAADYQAWHDAARRSVLMDRRGDL